MELFNSLQTIGQNILFENNVKKSRFIALVYEIDNETEARSVIKDISLKYPDASHHCWALRLGVGNSEIEQYSDDGEPVNSAGPPILQAIKQGQVTNLIVIVVRYFGGIKLGISGLIKAYRDTARMAIEKAGKKRKIFMHEICIENIEYKGLGTILQSVESRTGKITDIKYGDKVDLLVLLPEKEVKWFVKLVNNVTQGKALIKNQDTKWIDDL